MCPTPPTETPLGPGWVDPPYDRHHLCRPKGRGRVSKKRPTRIRVSNWRDPEVESKVFYPFVSNDGVHGASQRHSHLLWSSYWELTFHEVFITA